MNRVATLSVFYSGEELRIFNREALKQASMSSAFSDPRAVRYVFNRIGSDDEWQVGDYVEGFDLPRKKRSLVECLEIASRVCARLSGMREPNVTFVYDPSLSLESLRVAELSTEEAGYHIEKRLSFAEALVAEHGSGSSFPYYVVGGFGEKIWISLFDGSSNWTSDSHVQVTAHDNKPIGAIALAEHLARKYVERSGGSIDAIVSANLKECALVYRNIEVDLNRGVNILYPTVRWVGSNGVQSDWTPPVEKKWFNQTNDRCSLIVRELCQCARSLEISATKRSANSLYPFKVFGPVFSEPRILSGLKVETKVDFIGTLELLEVFKSQIMLASLSGPDAGPFTSPVSNVPKLLSQEAPASGSSAPFVSTHRQPMILPPKKDPALIEKVEAKRIAKPPVVPVLPPKKKKGSDSPVVGKIAVPPVLPSVDVIVSKLGTEPVKVLLPPKRESKKSEPAPTSSMVLPPKKSK